MFKSIQIFFTAVLGDHLKRFKSFIILILKGKPIKNKITMMFPRIQLEK